MRLGYISKLNRSPMYCIMHMKNRASKYNFFRTRKWMLFQSYNYILIRRSLLNKNLGNPFTYLKLTYSGTPTKKKDSTPFIIITSKSQFWDGTNPLYAGKQ